MSENVAIGFGRNVVHIHPNNVIHSEYHSRPFYTYIGSRDNDDVIIETKNGTLKISELLKELSELKEMVQALWYAPGSIAHTQAIASLANCAKH